MSDQPPFPVPIGWATPTQEISLHSAHRSSHRLSQTHPVILPEPEPEHLDHLNDGDPFAGPRAAGSASSDAELAMRMQLAELQSAQSDSTDSTVGIHPHHHRPTPWSTVNQSPDRYFTDPVWGEVYFAAEPTRLEGMCFACCPCWMVAYGGRKPPCCAKNQQPVPAQDAKRAWRRFLCSMTLLVSVLQTLILILLVCLCGGFVTLENNVMLGPPTDAFNLFGAKNAARIIKYGEFFRLVVPIMLHSGVFHLISNLFVQLKFGIQVEVIWGHRLWILIYFFSGIYGNVASCILLPDKLGVGASGGICGLIGAQIVFLALTWRQTLPKDIIERNALFASLIATMLLIVVISALPLMDFAAHIGGLVAGALIGVIVFAERAQERSDRFRLSLQVVGWILFGTLVASSVIILLLAVKPDDNLLRVCDLPEC